MNIKKLSIKEIFPAEEQPRKYFDEDALNRLSQSIKDNGIEQPITVRKSDKGYIIVDGERRFRASQMADVKEIDCIITDKENILEQQLRTDCLKEGLTVDELDEAIWNYCEKLKVTSNRKKFIEWRGDRIQRQGEKLIHEYIAFEIGKSVSRVQIAIDRFSFRSDNKEFIKAIDKKHNPENKPFSKVNSTIAMTDKLKDNEIRKEIIPKVLEIEKKGKGFKGNEAVKKAVDEIVKRKAETPEEASMIFDSVMLEADPLALIDKDPRTVLQNLFFDFTRIEDKLELLNFNTPEVKEMIQGKTLIQFIEHIEDFQIKLQELVI